MIPSDFAALGQSLSNLPPARSLGLDSHCTGSAHHHGLLTRQPALVMPLSSPALHAKMIFLEQNIHQAVSQGS